MVFGENGEGVCLLSEVALSCSQYLTTARLYLVVAGCNHRIVAVHGECGVERRRLLVPPQRVLKRSWKISSKL